MGRKTEHTKYYSCNFRSLVVFVSVAVSVLFIICSCNNDLFFDKIYKGNNYEIHYPHFIGEQYSTLNELITDKISSEESIISYFKDVDRFDSKSELRISYDKPYIGDNYISIVFKCRLNCSYAAHPSTVVLTVNYDIASGVLNESNLNECNIEFGADEIKNAIYDQYDGDLRDAALYSVENGLPSDTLWALDDDGIVLYIYNPVVPDDHISLRLDRDVFR